MREIEKSRKRPPNKKALAGKRDLPKMKVLMQKRFFSVREAALYTGLSARLIYQKLRERALCSYRVGRKIVLDVRDIDAFVMTNEVKSSDQLREILKEKMSGKRRKAGD